MFAVMQNGDIVASIRVNARPCCCVSPLSCPIRFSRPGDLVRCVRAEDSSCWKVALERGRQVELFVREEASRRGMEEKLKATFKEVYVRGIFSETVSRDRTCSTPNKPIVCGHPLDDGALMVTMYQTLPRS